MLPVSLVIIKALNMVYFVNQPRTNDRVQRLKKNSVICFVFLFIYTREEGNLQKQKASNAWIESPPQPPLPSPNPLLKRQRGTSISPAEAVTFRPHNKLRRLMPSQYVSPCSCSSEDGWPSPPSNNKNTQNSRQIFEPRCSEVWWQNLKRWPWC